MNTTCDHERDWQPVPWREWEPGRSWSVRVCLAVMGLTVLAICAGIVHFNALMVAPLFDISPYHPGAIAYGVAVVIAGCGLGMLAIRSEDRRRAATAAAPDGRQADTALGRCSSRKSAAAAADRMSAARPITSPVADE